MRPSWPGPCYRRCSIHCWCRDDGCCVSFSNFPGSASPTSRAPLDVYNAAGLRWALRSVGPHFHPGSEDTTVALAQQAEAFGLIAGARLLDIASAVGGPARYLARRFASTVLCIDIDLRMHQYARPSTIAEGLAARCLPLVAQAEQLPLRDGCCDGAWSQDALCHMEKPRVVREVARVLRPGGLFAFTDWIARGADHDGAGAAGTALGLPQPVHAARVRAGARQLWLQRAAR